jgi:Domain of unknown function (DUF4082)
VAVGSPVVVTGAAADSGGQVAGVEVSVDGGATWVPARGTSAWAHVFVPNWAGPLDLRSRSVDDSLNLETPGPSRRIEVVAREGPVTLWPTSAVPALSASNDRSPVEVGTKFQCTLEGLVGAVRFYKGAANLGPHTGRLWADGELLGTCVFTRETPAGWQQAAFEHPIAVLPGVLYVVSVHCPHGRYAADPAYFASGHSFYPLRAMAHGQAGPNGVLAYGDGGAYPSGSVGAVNFWVDVVFQPARLADSSRVFG